MTNLSRVFPLEKKKPRTRGLRGFKNPTPDREEGTPHSQANLPRLADEKVKSVRGPASLKS